MKKLKLTLNRETLRALDNDDAQRVDGGYIIRATQYTICRCWITLGGCPSVVLRCY